MSLTTAQERGLVELLARAQRDEFGGATLRGGWPKPPQVLALPTASVDFLFRIITLVDSTAGSEDDHTYQCLRIAGVPTWVRLDN